MKQWFGRMLSDGSGCPDEARVVFVVTMLVYLVLWVIWFACGGYAHWGESGVIAAFTGGASAIGVAFGATVRTRGQQ